MVLDANFKTLGEFDLPDKNANMFGISEKGIFYIILNTSKDGKIHFAAIDVEI